MMCKDSSTPMFSPSHNPFLLNPRGLAWVFCHLGREQLMSGLPQALGSLGGGIERVCRVLGMETH